MSVSDTTIKVNPRPLHPPPLPPTPPQPRPVDLRALVAAWPRLSLKQRAAALWRLREEEKAR